MSRQKRDPLKRAKNLVYMVQMLIKYHFTIWLLSLVNCNIYYFFQFQVSVDGDVICFKTSTMLKSMELKFKLGEEFDEKSPDGRDVKAIVTQEGDKFISVQTAKKEGEKSTEIIREFKGDEMIATSKCIGSDLVCTQVFKKQA